MSKRHRTKIIHEGQYIAEVEVELIETEDAYKSIENKATLKGYYSLKAA